jgi:hypothetical protein
MMLAVHFSFRKFNNNVNAFPHFLTSLQLLRNVTDLAKCEMKQVFRQSVLKLFS